MTSFVWEMAHHTRRTHKPLVTHVPHSHVRRNPFVTHTPHSHVRHISFVAHTHVRHDWFVAHTPRSHVRHDLFVTHSGNVSIGYYVRHYTVWDVEMQHTATHCNTLQHTATHCSTLQHTATHCSTHYVWHDTICEVEMMWVTSETHMMWVTLWWCDVMCVTNETCESRMGLVSRWCESHQTLTSRNDIWIHISDTRLSETWPGVWLCHFFQCICVCVYMFFIYVCIRVCIYMNGAIVPHSTYGCVMCVILSHVSHEWVSYRDDVSHIRDSHHDVDVGMIKWFLTSFTHKYAFVNAFMTHSWPIYKTQRLVPHSPHIVSLKVRYSCLIRDSHSWLSFVTLIRVSHSWLIRSIFPLTTRRVLSSFA